MRSGWWGQVGQGISLNFINGMVWQGPAELVEFEYEDPYEEFCYRDFLIKPYSAYVIATVRDGGVTISGRIKGGTVWLKFQGGRSAHYDLLDTRPKV